MLVHAMVTIRQQRDREIQTDRAATTTTTTTAAAAAVGGMKKAVNVVSMCCTHARTLSTSTKRELNVPDVFETFSGLAKHSCLIPG